MNTMRNLPFKFRIFFGCLIAAVIPLLFTAVLTTRIYDASFSHQTLQEGQKHLQQISERLQQMFTLCTDSCHDLNKDGTAAWSLIDNNTIDIRKDLYLSLYQAVQDTSGYAQFSVYDAGGKLRFSTDHTHSPAASLPLYWGLLRKVPDKPELIFAKADPVFRSSSDILLQAAYPLENSHGARIGYLVLDFTRDSLDRLLGVFSSDKDTLVLLDSFQNLIYCSRPDLNEEELQQVLNGTARQSDARYQYLWLREPQSGYYLLLQKASPVSVSALHTMQTITMLLALFCLGVCILISILLSRSIAQPISALDLAMQKVRNGDLSVRIYTNRRDELGRLSESFNRMTRELKENLELQVQKQKDLNETSLKLYQTQLNPHFLYNTLDTIKWNAKIHQNPDIPILAENLAFILRRSISAKPFITLSEELDTIHNYIEIQKIRFAGRFLYETEVPDQLENCLVPKMILQPLVENAILHGLADCENGYICIFAQQSEDRLLKITVTDDGCGMNAEMLAWLNSREPEQRAGHVGLFNVIQILKLYYGQEYGLSAASAPGEGTAVTITLPLERSDASHV